MKSTYQYAVDCISRDFGYVQYADLCNVYKIHCLPEAAYDLVRQAFNIDLEANCGKTI